MYTPKQLIRIVLRVREELAQLHRHRYKELLRRMNNCYSQLSEMQVTSQELTIATERNWRAAAEHCRERMNRDLYIVANAVSDLQRFSKTPPFTLPALRVLYEELRQVQEEFDTVTFDPKEGLLCVDTSPVELEDVYLGPFQIQLKIKDLHRHYTHSSYYVYAQDPHPASTNEEVTHPHISAEKLCEGDGAAAINAALHEGRLFDFFTLISNILHTYNPGSAYVKLEDWSGRSCYECGTEMSEDEAYYCQMCEREFCDGCSSSCHSCDTTGCLNCLDRCPVCDERICHDCLKTCKVCGEKCCINCMDLEERICPNCKTESEENHNDESNGNHEREIRAEGTSPDGGPESEAEREGADTPVGV